MILNWCPDESCVIGSASIEEKLLANSILNTLAVSIPGLTMLPDESVTWQVKHDC